MKRYGKRCRDRHRRKRRHANAVGTDWAGTTDRNVFTVRCPNGHIHEFSYDPSGEVFYCSECSNRILAI